jgi:hypothetical protein
LLGLRAKRGAQGAPTSYSLMHNIKIDGSPLPGAEYTRRLRSLGDYGEDKRVPKRPRSVEAGRLGVSPSVGADREHRLRRVMSGCVGAQSFS